MVYVRVLQEPGGLRDPWYHVQRKRWYGWETVRSYLWQEGAITDAKKLSEALNVTPERKKVIYTNEGSWQPKLWF